MIKIKSVWLLLRKALSKVRTSHIRKENSAVSGFETDERADASWKRQQQNIHLNQEF